MKMLKTFLPVIGVVVAIGGAITYVVTSTPSPAEQTAKVESVDTAQSSGWGNGPTSSVYGQNAGAQK
jgi:hypothetical protein